MTSPKPDATAADADHRPGNFLRHVIERDLEQGSNAGQRWGGSPGDGNHHEAGVSDPARIRTRFPPEPNGYLHIGHAKSIWLNYGLAKQYAGKLNLRYDDTNPTKEEQEYVDSIRDDVRWLGADWEGREFYASDYFDQLYDWAVQLIQAGKAYVCDLSAEEVARHRGDIKGGKESPYRNRSIEEN